MSNGLKKFRLFGFGKTKDTTLNPDGISAIVGSGKVTFSWNKVPKATRYSVSIYNPDTGSYTLRSAQITRNTYTASKLTNGKQYQFLIRAFVNGEWSPYTTDDFIRVTPGVSKPTYIKASPGNNAASFSWVGVAGADRYSVSIYDSATKKYTLRSAKVTKTTYTASKLTNGKMYQFLIRAHVNGKWSPYTAADFVKVTPKV